MINGVNMKKRALLISPLLTLSILVNCGSNNKPESFNPYPNKIIHIEDGERHETLYTYDKGLPIKIEEYTYFLEYEEPIGYSITQLAYDDHDNLTYYMYKKDEVLCEDYTLTYTYEPDTTTIVGSGLYRQSNFSNELIIKYDDLGRIALMNYRNGPSVEELEYAGKDVFEYLNDYEDYQKMKRHNNEDTIYHTVTREFDEQGRIITSTDYPGEHNNEDYSSQTTYTYDEYSCRTMIITDYNDGREIDKEIKALTYYKNDPNKILTSIDALYKTSGDPTYTVQKNEYDDKDRLKKETINAKITTEYFYD